MMADRTFRKIGTGMRLISTISTSFSNGCSTFTVRSLFFLQEPLYQFIDRIFRSYRLLH
jgi:hypothetical protein